MEIDAYVELGREAGHLFTCLFGEAPPPKLTEQYVHAHQILRELREFPAPELHTMRLIVSKRLNAAMIEPFLRRKHGRRHAVSAKLLLLVYLAECGEVQPGALRGGPQSRFAIVSAASRGVAGLLVGLYLKVRHGLL